MNHNKRSSPARGKRNQYLIYFVLFYPVALLASLATSLIALCTRDLPRIRMNIFHDAAERLNATLPWMYMGR